MEKLRRYQTVIIDDKTSKEVYQTGIYTKKVWADLASILLSEIFTAPKDARYTISTKRVPSPQA